MSGRQSLEKRKKRRERRRDHLAALDWLRARRRSEQQARERFGKRTRKSNKAGANVLNRTWIPVHTVTVENGRNVSRTIKKPRGGAMVMP